MNTLAIRIDPKTPAYPRVRLFIDGSERLIGPVTGCNEPNDPADILDTGALLPLDPPRRIAFYGCGCGEFGCANVAGLITRREDHVEWGDFRSVTGLYSSALPTAEDGLDPLESEDDDLTPRPYDLPSFRFPTDHYLTVVRDAMANRSWETRSRAVVRQVRASLSQPNVLATSDGTGVSVNWQLDGGRWVTTDLALPRGPTDRLAEALVALLERGIDPRQIEGRRLWRFDIGRS